MPSIKEYDTKLKSLKNTSKMTKTMKMVSASKLRKAQDLQRRASEYARLTYAFMARLAASLDSTDHPLFEQRQEIRRILLLVFTSDKGLCGGFNNNLIRMTERWIEEHGGEYEQVDMSFCGRRGYAHFRNRQNVRAYYEEATRNPTFEQATRINEEVCAAFLAHEYDAVYLVCNEFRSALSQRPTLKKILPVESTAFLEGGEPIPQDYIFEPSRQELLEELVPKVIGFQIYYALLENAAGEHGARMTAMDNATNNAAGLIDRYTLLRNRARQAAITTELIEIVAGAEAL